MVNNKKFLLKDFDLAFIDTETTGVELDHELTEIAVIRANPFNFSVIDEWESKIKPVCIDNADPDALKITGYSEEKWADAPPEEEVLKIFLQKTDGAILVGHNITFDWYYIHKALARYRFKPTFLYRALDTVSIAWQKLRNETENMGSFSLGELCDHFEISRENAHTALDDARTTYKVFLKLIGS